MPTALISYLILTLVRNHILKFSLLRFLHLAIAKYSQPAGPKPQSLAYPTLLFYNIQHYSNPFLSNYPHFAIRALINCLPLLLLIYLMAIFVNDASKAFLSSLLLFFINGQKYSEIRHNASAQRAPFSSRPKVSAFFITSELCLSIDLLKVYLPSLMKHSVNRTSQYITFSCFSFLWNIFLAFSRISLAYFNLTFSSICCAFMIAI